MRRAAAYAIFLATACSGSEGTESKPVCPALAVRACETDCGSGLQRGLQECKQSGKAWGECKCVVFDAGFEAGFVEAGASDAALEQDAADAAAGD